MMDGYNSTPSITLILLVLANMVAIFSSSHTVAEAQHNYDDALAKSILFFEGQRSGKLPSDQRMEWRKDSALNDGQELNVDLVGGYYDAGDNLKFGFPMAFTITVLSWSVLEFGNTMNDQLEYAEEAIRWGTDYLMKTTAVSGVVFAGVGDPVADHNCWERPEDMDTPRTVYAVNQTHPGSEIAAETAAALTASAIVFRSADSLYSDKLLQRAVEVFSFADKYRGSYNDSIGPAVCPFYCDYSGYQDELAWAAAWLHKATNDSYYWDYAVDYIKAVILKGVEEDVNAGEFGWDDKHAGISVLLAAEVLMKNKNDPISNLIIRKADEFVCTVLPNSPTQVVEYSPGGLLFKTGGSNMQHPAALSFLLLVYAGYIHQAGKAVQCGNNITANSSTLISLAKSQVDYILGHNPLNMSYIVGYGEKFPKRIHHRGSSLPSEDAHPAPITCQEGTPYYQTNDSNPNFLLGAAVGGPNINDAFDDDRAAFQYSEPTTYINAPLVGAIAYFTSHPST